MSSPENWRIISLGKQDFKRINRIAQTPAVRLRFCTHSQVFVRFSSRSDRTDGVRMEIDDLCQPCDGAFVVPGRNQTLALPFGGSVRHSVLMIGFGPGLILPPCGSRYQGDSLGEVGS